MKTTTAVCSFILSFCTALHLNSQILPGEAKPNLSKKKNFWECGINIYQLDFSSNVYLYRSYYYQSKKTENNFFRGINLNYYFGKNAVRSSLDYFTKGKDINKSDYFLVGSNYSFSRTGSLTLGYERLFLKAKFSPYIFTDLGYAYIEQKGKNFHDCYVGFAPGYSGDYFIKTSAYTVSGGLGLRYNPFRSLVLTLETNLRYYFIIEKEANNKIKTYNYNDFRLNPVQCSLRFIL